jgi:L-asparaginase/Glu-tRNA(Gln) amidotransferase subunit D
MPTSHQDDDEAMKSKALPRLPERQKVRRSIRCASVILALHQCLGGSRHAQTKATASKALKSGIAGGGARSKRKSRHLLFFFLEEVVIGCD